MIEQAHTEKKNDTPFRDALENAIATSPDREKLKAALEAPEQERNRRKAAKGEPENLQIITGVPRPGDEGVDESYVWKPSGQRYFSEGVGPNAPMPAAPEPAPAPPKGCPTGEPIPLPGRPMNGRGIDRGASCIGHAHWRPLALHSCFLRARLVGDKA